MSRQRAGAWLALAAVLPSDELPFQEFAAWSDIAGALVQGGT
jgi:hypothetical protein